MKEWCTKYILIYGIYITTCVCCNLSNKIHIFFIFIFSVHRRKVMAIVIRDHSLSFSFTLNVFIVVGFFLAHIVFILVSFWPLWFGSISINLPSYKFPVITMLNIHIFFNFMKPMETYALHMYSNNNTRKKK